MLDIFKSRTELFDISDDKVNYLVRTAYDSSLNITEKDILERLRDRYRWPKTYTSGQPTVERIVAEDGLKVQDFFSPDDNHLQFHKVSKYYQEGYTFVLSGVQYLFHDIADLTEKLSNQFGVELNCNLYISKGSKVISYPYHDHDYAVIIKNISGKSKWLIDGKEYVLKDQDVFFIDKFKYHCVKEILDTKISLTFNLH